MKNIILGLMLFAAFSCTRKSNEVSIRGNLTGFEGDKAQLVDLSDKAGLRMPKHIEFPVDQNGNFDLAFILSEAAYFQLGLNTLYLSPGDNLDITVDLSDKNKSVFNGRGAEACNFLKSVPDYQEIGYLGKNSENVREDIVDYCNGYMLPLAEKRLKEISELRKVSEEFRELEKARISTNIVRSIMLYTVSYLKKFVEGYDIGRDRELFSETRKKHLAQVTDVLMKYGNGLARAENIVLPEFRKTLFFITDTTGENMPVYTRVDRLEDYKISESLLMKYARCFTSFPTDLNPNDVLEELENAKKTITTDLYKELIDESVKQYASIRKGLPVSDFVGYDLNNNPVKLSDFKGKYVYLDFWATWCHACIKEYPYFQELSRKFKDREDIVFITVSTDQDKERWLTYMEKNPHTTISIIVDSSNLQPYKIAFIPRFIMVNKDFTFLDPFAPRPSTPEALELLQSLN